MSAIDGIEQRYNSPRTMELLFEQTYRGLGRPPRAESGRLYLRKPRRMRWEYAEPAGKLFLSDGQDVYFYSPSSNRVEKMRLKESGDLRTPLAFLMGRVDLRRDFEKFVSRPEGEALRITAFPKSEKAPYSQVEFLVEDGFRIAELVVTGQDQTVMSFRFSGEQVNPALEAGLFEFTMPPGAEFIELIDETDGSF